MSAVSFGCHNWKVLLASNEQRPRVLLSILLNALDSLCNKELSGHYANEA